MELAQAAAVHLEPVANALAFISTAKVHPVWFPYAFAPTLHAARVSIIYQTNARHSKIPLSWGQYLMGFLIMSWGGGLTAYLLLGLPAPMLYSFHPAINYITVHLFFTALFDIFPSLLHPSTLDTLLWPVDALIRTNGIVSTLGLMSSPNVHAEYRDSALAHLVIGAIASSGGGIAASTIAAWTASWTVGTPPFLRAGAGWAGTLDVWGGALVALIYSSLTDHPAFNKLHTYVTLALSTSPLSSARKPHADADFPPLSPLGAKAVAATVLAVLFAARTIKTHWLVPIPAKTEIVEKPKIIIDVPPSPAPKRGRKKATTTKAS